MSGKDGGWSLPEIIDPPRKCICIPVPDEAFHRQAFFGALNELGWQHNWQRDPEHKAMPTSIVWNTIVREAMERFYSEEVYMCFSCDELNACLAPLYDAIATLQTTVDTMAGEIDDLTEQVEELELSVTRGGATVQPPSPQELTECDDGHAYAGALAVVGSMNDYIMDIYEAAEAAPANDQNEELALIIQAIPVFETLPVDELFQVTDWMFQNQMEDYQGSYTETWEELAACKLLCYIRGDCELSHEDLTEWLYQLESQFPGNYAAEIFTRFGRATGEGLLQQIGQFVNDLRGGQSITSFYDSLMVDFGVGGQLTNPGYLDCDDCLCMTKYYRPGNLPPDLDVTYGTIGIENVLAASVLFNYPPDGDASTIIANMTVPVSAATMVQLIMDTNTQYGISVHDGVTTYPQDSVIPVEIAPGKWAISITLPGLTGNIEGVHLRTHPIPNTTPFLWLEMRIYEAC